jgi:cell division protein ZapA (FtsZ GTPase activity inhibitor)
VVPERGGGGPDALEDNSGVLAELGSMPSLRSLELPASCAERAVDAEAVYGLTTLTTVRFDRNGVVDEWVLDLSRLTTLTTLNLEYCAVTDKEVLALSNLTGLGRCNGVTAEGLRTVSSLTSLTTLTTLTTLNLAHCRNVTSEGLRAVSRLTLFKLNLRYCDVRNEGLLAVIR